MFPQQTAHQAFDEQLEIRKAETAVATHATWSSHV